MTGKIARVLCALWATWVCTAEAQAFQDEPALRIAAVEFVGLDQVSPLLVQDVTGVRVGEPFDRTKLDEALARLLRTRHFASARYETHDIEEGVRVVFHLQERRRVTQIRFEGNERFKEGALLPLVGLKSGDLADSFTARDGAEAIAQKYRDAGYGDVTVTFDSSRFSESGELIYQIEEGRRVRIRSIDFEGNQAFPARRLRRKIQTKKAFWIFRTGAFDEDRAQADVLALQQFYRDEGFLDARAGFRAELGDDGQSLRVVFVIEEGVQYHIEDIRFRGNNAFSTDELLPLLRSKMSEVVKPPLVEADAGRIQSLYGEYGYLYAGVRPVRVFSETPGLALITFDIQEGEQFRVGKVVVRGNARTKDKVVRRELNLFGPNDLFNLSAAQEAERDLVQTGVFSSARVYPAGDAPGVRDVVVDVVEAETIGQFLFAAGVTSNSGLVGSIVLDLRNFDISDWPQSWSEFFKLRAFTGGGQRLRLDLQPGREVNRFRIDFTEPYFLDRPTRLDAGVHLFSRARDGYDERRVGTTISLGKRFEQGPLRGWSGEVAFRVEDVSIDDVDLFASSEIRDDEGSNLLTSLRGTLVRDRTDSRLVPSTGDRLRLSYEQFGVLGGDHVFGTAMASYSTFHTLHTDARERKQVLHLRFEGGAIVGDAPVTERFYAGGTGSMRGFAFRGIGERDGIDENNIGGDTLVLVGGEYSFPLYEDNLRGLVFVDTGTVGNGPYRAAIGAGIRLTLNILRGVPLELSVGIPISKDSDDDTQAFSFVIGRLF